LANKTFPSAKTPARYRIPTDRELARRLHYVRYMDENGCSDCLTNLGPIFGGGPKARYVIGNECYACSRKRWDEAYRLWCMGSPGAPEPFYRTAEEAFERGASSYVPGPCEDGPHERSVELFSGECLNCRAAQLQDRINRRSPRAVARSEGRRWYEPADPCDQCKQRAPRNVISNACRGCTERPRVDDSADTQLMADSPLLVLSRADSKVMGFRVHRTGQPCGRGHCGWRYNSNGGCIDCKREGD